MRICLIYRFEYECICLHSPLAVKLFYVSCLLGALIPYKYITRLFDDNFYSRHIDAATDLPLSSMCFCAGQRNLSFQTALNQELQQLTAVADDERREYDAAKRAERDQVA